MAFKLENTVKQKKVSRQNGDSFAFLKKEITFGKSFSNKVKEDFYTEISVLLKAGVSLKDSLGLLYNSQKKKKNKEIIGNILKDLIQGTSLSGAIYNHKDFTEYEFYSIKIGEETGTLSKVTEQLGNFFARKNEQRRNLISALTYPIIILSTAFLVVLFMLQFVVPMFHDIFEQQKVELPWITRMIIQFSDFIQNHGWILILAVLAFFLSQLVLNKKDWYRKFKDQFILKIPFIGGFFKLVYLSQFTQAVSLLVAAKVPMLHSIQLVKKMINFHPLQEALHAVEEDILKGESLSGSLNNHKFFNEKMVALVKVAEETNQNEFIFERLNHQYNSQVQQQSKVLTTVMEPFIILFVGILVGVILIAMYLPMFKLSSVLG